MPGTRQRVQIAIAHAGTCREVTLEVDDPRACVGDLLAALDPRRSAAAAGLVVGGRFHGPDHGLDEVGLCDGEVVVVVERTPPSPPPPPPERPSRPVVAVTDGPRAGGRAALGRDEVVAGRDPGCDLVVDDPTVSERHALLRVHDHGRVSVTDLGSRNGTWLGAHAVEGPTPVPPEATLRLGASHLEVVAATAADAPTGLDPRVGGGTMPFNRPPRPALPPPPAEVTAPEPPRASTSRAALSAAAIIAPLIMGGVLIWVTGHWRFALFMLLSPMMAVGNFLGQRRRSKRDTAEADRRFRRDLERLRADLDHARETELARRRHVLPHAAEVVRRATQPATSLWQRRADHADWLRLRAGIGDVPWDPTVALPRQVHDDVARLVDTRRMLPAAPVEVDLAEGGVVGLVGDREAGLALARSLLVQAAVHHGPADLPIAVIAAPESAGRWDWAKWLPHVRDPAEERRWLAAGPDGAGALLRAALTEAERGDADRPPRAGGGSRASGPTRCWVVDDPALLEGRRAPARLVLRGAAGPATGIVLAPTQDQLPAVCDTVIECRSPLGDAELRRPQAGWRVADLVVCGMDDATARRVARSLARFEDPELDHVGTRLPGVVRLPPLLDLDAVDGAAVLEGWRALSRDPAPASPIGIGEDGPVEIDLRDDGPHALIGGTTGAGKSELLRSLVAGLAARVDPDHLVFVLVDYKGGSAFDRCADLPHTVGLVTDLDEHLGQRALVSLEAELRTRERILREAGAGDLPAYLAAGSPAGPVPRLVVVVDEFATLAAELPDFLGALVGIAQRGRSLGVHLILATQRPSGAVNASIKANTNLRIALRVTDDADSVDIIDRSGAARLSRATPGRAYVRRGAGDVALAQTALSATRTPAPRASGVRLTPFTLAPSGPSPEPAADERAAVCDLDRLVEATGAAWHRGGFDTPRRPWLPMLPEAVDLEEVITGADVGVPLGLADEPEQQRQVAVGWRPCDGHLALLGAVGSGTTTALRTVAQAVAHRHAPAAWHLYALDFGAGELAELEALPHVGAVVAASQREAQHRLIGDLGRQLERRRDLGPAQLATQPRIVVLLDGLAAFQAEHDDVESTELLETFRRLFAEGPTVRISFVVTADRLGALSTRLGAAVGHRLLLRLADGADYAAVGLRSGSLPRFVPGRAVEADSGRVVQLARPRPTGEVAAHAQRRWEGASAPALRTLPSEHPGDRLPVGGSDGGWLRLPIGIRDEDLAPASLELPPGEHAVVAGPPRSGKTSALVLLAHAARRAGPDTIVVGLCGAGSPLHGLDALDASGSPDAIAEVLRAAPADERPWLVLVDDATRVADDHRLLEGLLSATRGDLHVVGAARTDELRGDFGQWYRGLRRSRTGLLLQPDLPTDGDLLGARLPRRVPVSLPAGRGFLVTAGSAELVQVALPPASRTRG